MNKLPRFIFLFPLALSLGLAQNPPAASSPSSAPAPTAVSTTPPARNPGDAVVPAIVANGFDAYAKSGSKAALDVWFKGSPLETDAAAKGSLNLGMTKTEAVFGKMQGWDLLKVVALTPSAKIVYTDLKLDKGPLWIAFYCYRPTPASEWVVYSMGEDENPIKVLPPGLLAGS